ncbi:hypothetical protein C0995_010422 [Termitomyces sp. Mi166|nr:hypothetical protein C0995_010422 [Termitomyces sp. Mi166\
MFAAPWNDLYGRYYQVNPDVYPPYPAPYRYPNRPEARGSIKYPQLLYLLASDSTRLQWDVRYPPSHIHPTMFFQHRHTTAMQTSVKKMRIISKAFPWTIDINSHVPITCEMVWEGLYQGLQQPIVDSEWGMLCSMKRTQREAVEKAAKKRRDANPEDKQPLKRIDYLGEATMFGGLGQDEEFAKLRSFPGSAAVPDTTDHAVTVDSTVLTAPQHLIHPPNTKTIPNASAKLKNTKKAYIKVLKPCVRLSLAYSQTYTLLPWFRISKGAPGPPKNNYPPQPAASGPSTSQWGSGGRGGYGGRGGRGRGRGGSWGQQRSQATGPNATPLGTPTHSGASSPKPAGVQSTPVKEPEAKSVEVKTAGESEKTKDKKNKKRKAEESPVESESTNKKAKVAEEPTTEAVATSPEKAKKDKKDKKEKKSKSKKEREGEDVEMCAPVEKNEKGKDVAEVADTPAEKKTKKKSRKDKKSAEDVEMSAPVEEREKAKENAEDVETNEPVEEVKKKSKEVKKKSKEVKKEGGEDVVPTEEPKKSREKKKKTKTKNDDVNAAVQVEEDSGSNKSKKKREDGDKKVEEAKETSKGENAMDVNASPEKEKKKDKKDKKEKGEKKEKKERKRAASTSVQ